MGDEHPYSNAVELTQRTLEILKYIGGRTDEGLPSGEGIAVEIVLMPDLLLDFRSRYLNDSSRTICSVGGRAARAACALMHLQSKEDQLFRCRLLTRTGSLGTLLLSNEFDDTSAGDIFESDWRPCVLSRSGEPRCAIRYFLDSEGRLLLGSHGNLSSASEMISSSTPIDENELQFNRDIKNNRLICGILKRATALYFSSLRSEVYLHLLKDIVGFLQKTQGKPRIFADVTMPHDRHPEASSVPAFLDYLHSISGDRSIVNRFAALFIPMDTLKYLGPLMRLDQARSLGELSKNLNIPLIIYGKENKAVVFGPSSRRLFNTEDSSVDFSQEDVPERFKAGVVLAYSAWAALDSVQRGNDSLYSSLRGEWGDDASPGFWDRVIRYGFALAAAHPKSGTSFASFEDLIKVAHDPGNAHFPDARVIGTQPFDAAARNPNFFTDRVLLEHVHDLVRAAGYRRVRLFSKHQRIFICERSKCTRCIKRERETEASAAVLLDLDSTLLDSTDQRNGCLRPVMEHVLSDDTIAVDSLRPTDTEQEAGTDENIEIVLDLFQKNVYDLWRLYKKWEFSDFRQQWNTEGWYASLIALLKDCHLRHEISAIEKKCRLKSGVIDQEAIEKCAESNTHLRKVFSDAYDSARRNHATAIIQAIHIFSKRRMSLYREAFDFIVTVDQVPGIRLYVVSEGHPDTQWMKMQSTGLSDYIPRNRLLTTGEAAQPQTIRQLLRSAGTEVSERKQVLEIEQRQLKDMYHMLADLRNELHVLRNQGVEIKDEVAYVINAFMDKQDHKITRRQVAVNSELDLLDHRRDSLDCLDSILCQMSEKKQVTFYAGVVRAILHDPLNPRGQLTSWERLVSDSQSHDKMKFAMVGDRQRNDIWPPLELLSEKGILTIRMLSKNYANEDSGSHQPSAAYTVSTLAQAKVLLLSHAAWDKIDCTCEPPFFNCVLTSKPGEVRKKPLLKEKQQIIGVHHVIFGIDMIEYPLIHQLFVSILGEFLRRSTNPEQCEDIAKIVLDTPCDDVHPYAVRRCILAISAIVTANAFSTFTEETRIRLAEQLTEGITVAKKLELSQEAPQNFKLLHDAIGISVDALDCLMKNPDERVSSVARRGHHTD